MALDAGGLDNSGELMKVKEYQAKMRDFIKQTGLQRRPVRERVVGAGKAAKVVIPAVPVVPVPVPVIKFYLPKSFRDKLQEVYDNGTIEAIIRVADSGNSSADALLWQATLDRIETILKDWDQLFYE